MTPTHRLRISVLFSNSKTCLFLLGNFTNTKFVYNYYYQRFYDIHFEWSNNNTSFTFPDTLFIAHRQSIFPNAIKVTKKLDTKPKQSCSSICRHQPVVKCFTLLEIWYFDVKTENISSCGNRTGTLLILSVHVQIIIQ